MKAYKVLLAAALVCVVTTACQSRRPCDKEVVCEEYVHRYGVSLPPEEWSDRGEHGQVISTRRDGVVVAKTYESGVLHGETSYTFPHREVTQKKEVYHQGELKQAFSYYPNGMPQQQITYETPDRYKTVVWYEAGNPQCKEEYEGGCLARGVYYTVDDQEESKVENHNGMRTKRNAYGLLESMDDIQQGQMVSRTTYHPNGSPAALSPYVNGVIEGERRTYTLSGEPATIEQWTGDRQHGNTVVFENGEKRADVPYVNGYRHGVERCYRDGEALVQKNTWVQGRKHGPSYTYVGSTVQTDWYFQDRPVNKPTFDALSNQ